MADLSFERLCTFLATTHGGYTVWLGAGAAMALTNGAMPSWSKLVEDLAAGRDLPPTWGALDFASRLDWLAGQLGHAAFRRALRRAVVEPMVTSDINEDVARQMAIIGLRAGAIASFNIEMMSSLPMSTGRGGSFISRPYHRPGVETFLKSTADGGVVGTPVFFPHGLLDIEGDCVITKSEYLEHSMSLAVGTAVCLCLGGDLLILGMSLDDTYLRDAILQQRRWIRDIFWVTNSVAHAEWARVANVHRVPARFDEMWRGIADAHLRYDTRGELKSVCDGDKGVVARSVRGLYTARQFVSGLESGVTGKPAQDLSAGPHFSSRAFAAYARQCQDLGFELPEVVRNDPRYVRAWTERNDPYANDTFPMSSAVARLSPRGGADAESASTPPPPNAAKPRAKAKAKTLTAKAPAARRSAKPPPDPPARRSRATGKRQR